MPAILPPWYEPSNRRTYVRPWDNTRAIRAGLRHSSEVLRVVFCGSLASNAWARSPHRFDNSTPVRDSRKNLRKRRDSGTPCYVQIAVVASQSINTWPRSGTPGLPHSGQQVCLSQKYLRLSPNNLNTFVVAYTEILRRNAYIHNCPAPNTSRKNLVRDPSSCCIAYAFSTYIRS